jgi:hypothetical protein
MKKWTRPIIVTGVLLALALTASLLVAQAKKPSTLGGTKNVNVKAGEIVGTSKICSGVNPNQWRDSILAPDTWQIGACQAFASSIGALHYQLGCATPRGFVWSPMDNSANPGCWP